MNCVLFNNNAENFSNNALFCAVLLKNTRLNWIYLGFFQMLHMMIIDFKLKNVNDKGLTNDYYVDYCISYHSQ